MSLMKSISGIRGTIGGCAGDNLSPIDIVKFTSAYAYMLKEQCNYKPMVVVGRDARVSGNMVRHLVCGTLMGCGIDVTDIGLASTPTTEMAVVFAKANGGIIITASHNPAQWNALKLLNQKGEFLNADEGKRLLEISERSDLEFSDAFSLGSYTTKDFTQAHIDAVLNCKYADIQAIKNGHFTVVLDAINSVGGIIVPELLKQLGVNCIEVNCAPTGCFAHNPEPLPQHLKELSQTVAANKASLGISVDPDVDRLALICEDGTPFGEEYTLVACAQYVLGQESELGKPLNTVSNLSSSRALKDITESFGGTYTASAVGEVNVTSAMYDTNAIIGGEGNGGVILPCVHSGRDALVGIVLFLSHLAHLKVSASQLRDSLPAYYISKNRIDLPKGFNPDRVLKKMKEIFANQKINTADGIRIDFEDKRQWVHLRKSNTEPIIRVYSEAPDKILADNLALDTISKINNTMAQLLQESN